MKIKMCILFLVWFLFSSASFASAAVNVRDFGAIGDGETDDTEAIERAISEGKGVVEFPKGDYRITRTIEVDLDEGRRISLNGQSGSARILMAGAGPAFRFIGTHDGTALADSFAQGVLSRERMPQITGLEIFGEHPEADGLEFIRSMQAVVSRVLIRDVRVGIRLSERNRNVIIDSSHIYNCSGIGVFLDDVDLHQAIISSSHISYNKGGGIVIRGGSVRNVQITGNDIEYNHDLEAEESNDVLIDVSQGGSIREGTIASNTIQARYSPGGANVRFRGNREDPAKVGLWSIAGNHISNQRVNIHLDSARGISVSGNNFILGREQVLLIENSRHISVSGNVSDYNPDYYRIGLYHGSENGVRIRNSDGVIVNGLILDGSAQGSSDEGGAIEILGSKNITISESQLFNFAHRGIWVADSKNIRIAGNTIGGESETDAAGSAITVIGASERVFLHGNLVSGADAISAEPGTDVRRSVEELYVP